MRELIDSYLNDDAYHLLYCLLYQDRPEWSQALFNFLTAHYELLSQHPQHLLAQAQADGLSKYPELQELLGELTSEQSGCWLRADWPFRKAEKPLREWTGHDDSIGGLVFLSANRLASSSEDGWIRIWEGDGEEASLEVGGHDGMPVNYLVYDQKGNLLISCGDDFTVRLWDADTLEEKAVLEGHENYVSAAAVQGDRLVTVSKDQTVGIWDLAGCGGAEWGDD